MLTWLAAVPFLPVLIKCLAKNCIEDANLSTKRKQMGIEPNNKKENRGKSHQVRFQAVRIYFTVEISIARFLGIVIAC